MTLPSLKPTSQTPPIPFFEIDRDGEMPEGAIISKGSTSTHTSRQQTPVPSDGSASTVPRLSSFPPYELPDELIRTSTPEPIKVTRAKKKGTGKKKRTPTATIDT